MKELLWIFPLLLLRGSQCGEADKPSDDSSKAGIEGTVLVKRAAGDPFSRRSAVDKNFIRFGRSGSYLHEKPEGSSRNLISYARVSRAANDNFMRFGRGDLETLYQQPTVESTLSNNRRGENFMRFGRGGKDNFIRFGRAKDNFMRFGRAKDNFMRFGRGKDNFMRFGRGNKDNFIRFGRAKDNFMRFGRGKDNFMRFGRGKDNFMRFGRIPDDVPNEDVNLSGIDLEKKSNKGTFIRLGKSPKNNEDGFIRFGRNDPDSDPEDPKIDDDGPEEEIGDLDLQSDKSKNGPVIRIKRDTHPLNLWEIEGENIKRVGRDVELMEEIPPLTEKERNRLKGLKKRDIDSDLFLDSESGWSDSEGLDPSQVYSYLESLLKDDKQNTEGGGRVISFG